MASLNKVMIIGRLGNDPELRSTKTGTPVLNMRLATSESITTAGEKKEQTEWHNVVAWGKLAELCNKYLKKGSLAYVEGRLTTRFWEKDGQKHFATDIVASSVQFLSPKGEGHDEKNLGNPFASNNAFDAFSDIPF